MIRHSWPPPRGEMQIVHPGDEDERGRVLNEGPDLRAIMRANIDMPCGIHTAEMWGEIRVTEEFLAEAQGADWLGKSKTELLYGMNIQAHSHGCVHCGKHCDCKICQQEAKRQAARRALDLKE